MPKFPPRAMLIKKLTPGLLVIAVGLLGFIALRLFAPQRVELIAMVFFFSNMIGFTLAGIGFISWFKPRPPSVETPLQELDTAENRANFTRGIIEASRLPVERECDGFIESADFSLTHQTQIVEGECWSSDIQLGGDIGYRARAYFVFANGKVGFAMIFGKPGVWHQGCTLVSDYHQEGSIFTLTNPFGDLTAWGEKGTRFLFCRDENGDVVARLSSIRFAKLEPYDVPPILKPLLGL